MPENFLNFQPIEKLKVVLNSPENVKVTAQFLVDICNTHSNILFKNSLQ